MANLHRILVQFIIMVISDWALCLIRWFRLFVFYVKKGKDRKIEWKREREKGKERKKERKPEAKKEKKTLKEKWKEFPSARCRRLRQWKNAWLLFGIFDKWHSIAALFRERKKSKLHSLDRCSISAQINLRRCDEHRNSPATWFTAWRRIH